MKIRGIYIFFIFIFSFSGCTGRKKADIIIHNAVIYTIDNEFTTAESAVIKNGRFIATGKDSEILKEYSAEQIIDLQGKYVYPGLIDPHCHFYGYGMNLKNADLGGTTSFGQIIEILKDHHKKYPSRWLLGRGWDQNLWKEKEFIHLPDLDDAFPHTPVLLTRVDGHAAIANSMAMKLSGINPDTEVEGGEIIKKNGQPSGLLIDNAIELVRSQIPDPGIKEKAVALKNAQEYSFRVGLTSVGDAGLDREIILLIDSLQKQGELSMRIYAMLSPTTENFEEFMYKGPYKTDFLSIRSIKLFADGALGSRGALLLEPYSDDPGNKGLQLETTSRLKEISELAYEHGYQVNTHCIGDSAVRLMLNIYGEVLGGSNDRRWRIEHAQIVHPSDFNLFGTYSVIPSIQTTHATSDMSWAADRIGEERTKTAYAYKQLLEQNQWLPNGSDFPVEHINPLYGFYAAIARKNLDGKPNGGWQTENALTREQALRGMTIWAAKAQFEENEKGSIEPGKLADFIVLDHDLMQVDADTIPHIKINKTFLAGEMVYSK